MGKKNHEVAEGTIWARATRGGPGRWTGVPESLMTGRAAGHEEADRSAGARGVEPGEMAGLFEEESGSGRYLREGARWPVWVCKSSRRL